MALSKTQNHRLGSILAVMFKDSLSSEILNELIKDGFVQVKGQDYILTDKGLDEKNRLCTLSGLNIMYSSEKKKVI
tara:strand:- start:1136 stop:1363 length:228 start_codon:yes stop_codon:yes gene_type:complete